MTDKLFVYGTLAPGRSNAHIMDGINGTWEPATVRGKLYSVGWGAAEGYPGIILNENADEVEGFIFRSSELPDHWDRLDKFEGPGYQRVITSAKLEDGTVIDACVYQLSDKSYKSDSEMNLQST